MDAMERYGVFLRPEPRTGACRWRATSSSTGPISAIYRLTLASWTGAWRETMRWEHGHTFRLLAPG